MCYFSSCEDSTRNIMTFVSIKRTDSEDVGGNVAGLMPKRLAFLE